MSSALQPKRRAVLHSSATVVAILAAMLGSSGSLEGQVSFTGRVFSGYGTPRGYGLGIGADAGIQFPFLFGMPATVGGFVNYHFGTEFLDEDLGETVEQRILFVGPQAGAVWYEGTFFLRGSGQLGAASVRREVGGGEAETESNFFLGGGMMIGKRFGDLVVSVEPFFPIVFGSDHTSAGFALYLNFVYQTPLSR